LNQPAELIHAFLVAEQIEERVRTHDFHDAIHVVSQKAQGIFTGYLRFAFQESEVCAVVPLDRSKRMFNRTLARP
jgi:hypothetical protein